jgi:DNA primase
MSPRNPGAPDQRRREEDPQRALAALNDRLLAEIGALRTGEDWASWLRLAARHPGQSFANVLLIAAQRPGAFLVAGYEAWQALGRQVSKGEPGIQVLADSHQPPGRQNAPPEPVRRRAAARSAGRPSGPQLTYLWDITQTTGPPTRGPAITSPSPGRVQPGLWDALTWLARREGFTVEREFCGQAGSATIWDARRIRVRPDIGDAQAAQGLLHQLGHVLLHTAVPHRTWASTACCRGSRKVEADSAGFLISARLGLDTSGYSFPSPAIWAGTDPRARPEETIRAAGTHITTAAATITAHLDSALFATPPPQPVPVAAPAPQPAGDTPAAQQRAATASAPAITRARTEMTPAAAPDPPAAVIGRALLDAERFYLAHLDPSWAPGYLRARGFGPAIAVRWHIGYAPAGWTALLDHLRGLGHDDAAIEAAGLARRSSRGTLIDHFRDRVMLPIRNEHGTIAGFIARGRPDAGPTVPKYLNTPQTAAYAKGDILFGLHEARDQLARGAMPVIVEGPFDAIAVTTADPRRYAGLAPCGTALTARQIAALARAADLSRTGVLVALDGDSAGRKGIVRAYEILLPHTSMTTAATFPAGIDPAKILETSGAAELSSALQHVGPLAQVVIDIYLDSWARQLDHPEGQLNARRSAAALIARMLPPETASEILQATGGRNLAILDDDLRVVVNPELPAIARILPPGAACQIVRVADRTGCDYSDVTAEVANAALKNLTTRKHAAALSPGGDRDRAPPTPGTGTPAALAAPSFPVPPCVASLSPGKPDTTRRPRAGRPEQTARRTAHR